MGLAFSFLRGLPHSLLRRADAVASRVWARKLVLSPLDPGTTMIRPLTRLLLAFLLMTPLAGCGVAAAPCRVVSAGLKAIPLIGHVAAAPTDACAAVID